MVSAQPLWVSDMLYSTRASLKNHCYYKRQHLSRLHFVQFAMSVEE